MRKIIWFTALQPWITAMLLVENPPMHFLIISVIMACFILFNQISED